MTPAKLRRGGARRARARIGVPAGIPRGQEEATSTLHEERLDAVVGALLRARARTVIDLGCGAGALLRRLGPDPRFTRVVGVDASIGAVGRAERAVADFRGRVAVRHASLLDPDQDLRGFDAAALVEVIEHVRPAELSRLEHAVFAAHAPRLVVVTTPNRDYNQRLGLGPDELRHRDHAFEWGRARFRRWSEGAAARNGYAVTLRSVGRADPLLGSATQMAEFRRLAA